MPVDTTNNGYIRDESEPATLEVLDNHEAENENEQNIRNVREREKWTINGFLKKVKNSHGYRIFLGILCVFLVGLLIPTVLFYFMLDGVEESILYDTCSVLKQYRVSCGLKNVTKDYCESIRCCYSNETSSCYHYAPSRYRYGDKDASTRKKSHIPWSLKTDKPFTSLEKTTPYMEESINLYVSVHEKTSDYLVVIIDDKAHTNTDNGGLKETNYKHGVVDSKNDMHVNVWRADNNNDSVLTTRFGPTIASRNYLEWTVDLSANKLFGLGGLKIPDDETIRHVIYSNEKDHNTVASLMAYNNETKLFHGLKVKHDGLLDITILPSKLIHLRSLFSNKLELHIFMGPKPGDIMEQYKLLNSENQLNYITPYWTLGVHICRDGLTSLPNALKEFEGHLLNTRNEQLPYDSDCINENLFLNPFNLISENHDEIFSAVENLKEKGKNFMMTLSPHIPFNTSVQEFNDTVEAGVLYLYEGNEAYKGSYKNVSVAYPDYSLNESNGIREWLEKFSRTIWKNDISLIKGLLLRDNWPASEGYNLTNALPEYFDELTLTAINYTLPWNTTVCIKEEENTCVQHSSKHSGYGSDHAKAIQNTSIFSEVEFIMSASYSQGSGFGAHIQNVNISWANLRQSVVKSLYHSMFDGSPISIPVCGSTAYYNPKSHEQMCTRWYQAAATLPVLRISSDWPRRDPLNLATKDATQIAVNAIKLRYSLMPYFYTVLLNDEPLARPMFYSFSEDEQTYDLNEQYMVGDAILSAPVLWPDLVSINVYLPDENSCWFEFAGGENMGWGGRNVTLPVVNSDFVLFLRSGHIIPTRDTKRSDSLSVEESRLNDSLELLVALNCTKNDSCISQGSVNVNALSPNAIDTEKNETVSFKYVDKTLTISNLNRWNCSEQEDNPNATTIKTIYLYGVLEENLQKKIKCTSIEPIILCSSEDSLNIEINYLDNFTAPNATECTMRVI